jgi:hypothetical protein
MSIVAMDTYRRLKYLRAKVAEFESAIDEFEGELMDLGVLRAMHYVAKYRAEELRQAIRGDRNE